MSTHSSVNVEDDPTLLAQQKTIDYLKSAKKRSKVSLSFPADLEKEYHKHRARVFLAMESKILLVGVLIYLVYSWADVSIGGDNGFLIAAIRMAIALVLLSTILWFMYKKTQNGKLIDRAIAVMILLAFNQVILSGILIETPLNYVYMVGVIPVQVFAIIAQRLNYRMLVLSSSISTIVCLLVVVNDQRDLTPFGLDEFATILIPVFITFWLILIGVGGYVNFVMESAFRRDYINNRILSLEAERLNYMMRLLKNLSTTDGLTGLINRREFEENLKESWQQAQIQNTPISLLMLDVDFFKQYNDYYGHQAGDRCLQSIAATLFNSCMSKQSVCARYGGEEFIVILPNTSKQQALEMAEDIRLAILEQAIVHAGSPMQVCTLSIGVSTGGHKDYNSAALLLKQADDKLYKAKQQGRNQVVSAL